MVEATNFIEKTLGKSLDGEKSTETIAEINEEAPKYTPPITERKPKFIEAGTQTQQILQEPTIQIVEKIVYKKQRIHGFFRTLTIIALLTIGFLMLGESTGIITLSVNKFKLHQIFPIFIIFSTLIIRSYKGIFGKIFGLILFLGIFGGIFTIGIYTGLNPSTKRKSGNTIDYAIINTGEISGDNNKTSLYVETLIGNSHIIGSKIKTGITSIRNSDRNLLVSSGNNTNENYIKFNEDSNRNILENYVSNINLTLPYSTTFDLIYIKNLFGLHIIDLSAFQWKILKFHAGIDDITIKVDNILSGNKIEIQGTAANIDMSIPKDIGVIMYYKHWLGKLQTTDFDILSGHYFQSKNINTAKAILNIYINLGAGNTKINRVEPQ